MSSSKVTCKLFKLKGIESLEDVRNNILKRDYADPLKFSARDAEKVDALTEEEKNFYFTWGKEYESHKLYLQNKHENNEEDEEESVEYFFITAEIEYTKRRKKDKQGNILPKSDRVNYTQIITYFFSINNSVHLIICSSNEPHIERVKKLVGTSYIAKKDEEYKVPSDLFNWLFFQYTQNKGLLEEKFKLKNINGFIGNTGDEHNIFKGVSDQTSELIVTKAFISNGEILNTITARIQNDDIDIVFAIDDKSNTQIYLNQSKKLKILEAEDDSHFLIVYLYSQLIPELKSLYDKASEQFLSTEKKQFSEKIGLEVIESIIDKNLLSLEDVTALFDKYSDIEDTKIKSSVISR